MDYANVSPQGGLEGMGGWLFELVSFAIFSRRHICIYLFTFLPLTSLCGGSHISRMVSSIFGWTGAKIIHFLCLSNHSSSYFSTHTDGWRLCRLGRLPVSRFSLGTLAESAGGGHVGPLDVVSLHVAFGEYFRIAQRSNVDEELGSTYRATSWLEEILM